MSREVPTKTTEEIMQHDQWYAEYLTLLENKKKAIEEWKEHKKVREFVSVDCFSYNNPFVSGKLHVLRNGFIH